MLFCREFHLHHHLVLAQIPVIQLADYQYDLPSERIARYPLAERDQSRLLIYEQGQIRHSVFTQLPTFLSSGWTLFFNNTRVLPARLYFRKETGALIEVFLLYPVRPTPIVSEAMQVKGQAIWKCAIGNLKRWKSDDLRLTVSGMDVAAKLIDREQKLVQLTWPEELGNFAQMVEAAGKLPLPPYLHREAEPEDLQTYQTVYGKKQGAVAAPTAGLHFTQRVFEALEKAGVGRDELTLHVGAGTFLPVQAPEDVAKHVMHCEQVIITTENLSNIGKAKKIAAVGTTSMRTLESLYWYGTMLLQNPDAPFQIPQDIPYQLAPDDCPGVPEALEAVRHRAEQQGGTLIGETGIFLLPGYQFRICDALVTNFHQPSSTLMLLVAAFIGEDWRRVYAEALQNDYRFLSYGDSSLLFVNPVCRFGGSE